MLTSAPSGGIAKRKIRRNNSYLKIIPGSRAFPLSQHALCWQSLRASRKDCLNMPLKASPGFHVRLRDAMRANGLDTAEDLAHAVGIPIPSARTLLKKSTPYVDAVTLMRICDRLRFSGRWLVNNALPVTMRMAVDPDEQRLLEIVRQLPAHRRDVLFDLILDFAHKTD